MKYLSLGATNDAKPPTAVSRAMQRAEFSSTMVTGIYPNRITIECWLSISDRSIDIFEVKLALLKTNEPRPVISGLFSYHANGISGDVTAFHLNSTRNPNFCFRDFCDVHAQPAPFLKYTIANTTLSHCGEYRCVSKDAVDAQSYSSKFSIGNDFPFCVFNSTILK